MKLRIALNVTFGIILFLGAIHLYGEVVEEKGNYYKTIKDFYTYAESREIDVLFFGSSHAYCTYNTKIIDNILGINSYNLGGNAQRLISTNYLLDEALTKTRPQLVVLDLYWASIQNPADSKARKWQYPSFDYTRFSLDKLLTMAKIFEYDELGEAIFPGIRYHDKWKDFDLNNISGVTQSNIGNYKGFTGFNQTISGKDSQKYLDFLNVDLHKQKKDLSHYFSNQELNNISLFISAAKKSNCEVLLVSAPYITSRYIKGYEQLNDMIKSVADENEVQYLDFNDHFSKLELKITDFKDKGHTNNSGAIKVTEYLSKYINDNFNLDTRRKNSTWHEDNRGFQEYIYYNPAFVDQLPKKVIHQKLSDNIFLEEMYSSKSDIGFTLYLKLNNDTDPDELSTYKFYFHSIIYPSDSIYLPEKLRKVKAKGYNWDFIPEIHYIDGEKFLIKKVKTPIKSFSRLDFGLYDRQKYNGLMRPRIKITDFRFE